MDLDRALAEADAALALDGERTPDERRLIDVAPSPRDALDDLLTRRELEVLGLLLEGWTNSQMAAALTIAKRTVVVHLEHIMSKLQATTRTMAAMRARGRGLFVPAELVTGLQRAALEE